MKVDNRERNVAKSLVINAKECPRSHCETRPLADDLELWRPKTATIHDYKPTNQNKTRNDGLHFISAVFE